MAHKAINIKVAKVTASNGVKATAVIAACFDMLGLTSDLTEEASGAVPSIFLVVSNKAQVPFTGDVVLRKAYLLVMAGVKKVTNTSKVRIQITALPLGG